MNNTESITASGRAEGQGANDSATDEQPQSPLRSRLFWRIATVVFLCIITIEAILLIFSWFAERDRWLMRIDDSLALLAPILSVSERYEELDRLVSHTSETGQHDLQGYILKTDQGTLKSGGDIKGLEQVSLEGMRRSIDYDTGFYDSVLSLTRSRDNTAMTLWYRVDASHVKDELRGFVVRIVGLVVLISVFVTAGCLLGLTPLLIRPLQKLDRLMLIGQRKGLRKIMAPTEFMERQDELGNVYRSFEQLTQALISAEDDNVSMTERFQGFADLGADSFWETDHRFRINYAAGDIVGMFGMRPQELIGLNSRQMGVRMAGVIPEFPDLASSLKAQGFWEGAIHSREGGTNRRTVRIVAKTLVDDQGLFRGVRGAVIDTSVASKLAAELQYQASHDSLTGLYNRREFARLLTQEMREKRRGDKSLCVCMLDLDRFKVVNDNCGHAAGDELLKQLARQIQSSVRKSDAVSRHGGDEFTVLLRECSLEDGVRIAETIRKAICEFKFQWEARFYTVGVSIGITRVLEDMDDGEAAILAADSCCIKAKNMGRNQVQAYSSTDESVARKQGEIQWMTRISQALEEDGFLLYQQPIMAIGDERGERSNCEILLRMQGLDGQVHCPEEFLPAAQRYGFMGQIDRWVIDHVIAWLQHQSLDTDKRLRVHINLSGSSVSDDSFQVYLRDKLNAEDVRAHHLCFEITETVALGDTAKTIEFLKEIRAIGCRVALDDFGTGFSSLSQLKRLPLDYIKIDGEFIQGIADNPHERALVKCIADFASILNVKTVAEAVESEEVYTVLEELSIDYAQGYLFGEPGPMCDVSELCTIRQSAA